MEQARGKARVFFHSTVTKPKNHPSLPLPPALSTPAGVPLRAVDFGSSFPSSLLRLAASLRRRVSVAAAAALGGSAVHPVPASRLPPAPVPLRRLSRASGDGGAAAPPARSPPAPTQAVAAGQPFTHKRSAAARTPAAEPRAKRRRLAGAVAMAAAALPAHSSPPPLSLAARVAAAGALFADAIKGMHVSPAGVVIPEQMEAEAGAPAAAPPPPPPPPRLQPPTTHPTLATSARADVRTAAGVALSGVGARHREPGGAVAAAAAALRRGRVTKPRRRVTAPTRTQPVRAARLREWR